MKSTFSDAVSKNLTIKCLKMNLCFFLLVTTFGQTRRPSCEKQIYAFLIVASDKIKALLLFLL